MVSSKNLLHIDTPDCIALQIESARLLDEEEFSDVKDHMMENGVGDTEATLPKTIVRQSDHYGSSSEQRDDGDTTTNMVRRECECARFC